MTDLSAGESSPCTYAFSINTRDQIIGGTCGTEHLDTLVWDHGRQYDLNTLVAPSSEYHLTETEFINDQGEVIALGLPPNGHQHLFLLEPKDSKKRRASLRWTERLRGRGR